MNSSNELKSGNLPEPGEFWLAKFHYEEQDGRYKVRPVFVLKSYPYGVLVAFCGTQKLDTTSCQRMCFSMARRATNEARFPENSLSELPVRQ
jgi:hypothetical protein